MYIKKHANNHFIYGQTWKCRKLSNIHRVVTCMSSVEAFVTRPRSKLLIDEKCAWLLDIVPLVLKPLLSWFSICSCTFLILWFCSSEVTLTLRLCNSQNELWSLDSTSISVANASAPDIGTKWLFHNMYVWRDSMVDCLGDTKWYCKKSSSSHYSCYVWGYKAGMSIKH